MPVTNEQGQSLENALNNIRTKVHDDVELLPAVVAFSDALGETSVTGELTESEAAQADSDVNRDPITPSTSPDVS